MTDGSVSAVDSIMNNPKGYNDYRKNIIRIKEPRRGGKEFNRTSQKDIFRHARSQIFSKDQYILL